MTLFALAVTLHLLSVVVWVGGMFFAHQCLRPVAAGQLEPPQRLRLWVGVFGRFFPWVWISVVLILASGYGMVFMVFSGFGSGKTEATVVEGEIKPINVEDAFYILEAASNVAFIPGYGMAVAQAQHVTQELATVLEKRGADVNYAIHPVAGLADHLGLFFPGRQVCRTNRLAEELPNLRQPRLAVPG